MTPMRANIVGPSCVLCSAQTPPVVRAGGFLRSHQ
jgi:hypothetical protein